MPEKSTYFYPKLSTGLVIRVDPEMDAGPPVPASGVSGL
jgi:hypothetical protein